MDGGSSDNCGSFTNNLGNITYTCEDIGDQIITVTLTDDSGNTSTVDLTISVKDSFQCIFSNQ